MSTAPEEAASMADAAQDDPARVDDVSAPPVPTHVDVVPAPPVPARVDDAPAHPVPAHPARVDDVQQRIDRAATRIGHHLDRLCPGGAADACAAWLPPELLAVAGESPGLGGRLHRALSAPIRQLTDAQGKRWRPVLLWEAVELLGGDAERYGPLIAAVELLHTGSLIVDDVQDASPLRRGRPAVHTVFGVATALNAGTAAYFLWDRAVQLTCPDDVHARGELRALLLTALRAGHAGQALDLQGHREEMEQAVSGGDRHAPLRQVRLTHRLKSGAPVAAALEMAAIVTRADPQLRAALGEFGSAVGTAYQIADDVADLRGVHRAGTPTKEPNEDLRAGKVTMPLAHAAALLPRPRSSQLWQRIREGTDLAEAARELEACGAVAACREEADGLLCDAWDRLRPLLPPGVDGRSLYDLATLIVGAGEAAG